MTLSGMGTMEQLRDNIKTMGIFVPLNEEERQIIEKAAQIIKNAVAVPCTSCGYCVEAGCPKGINIPKYFELYNSEKTCRISPENSKAKYKKLTESFGMASACIGCGKCEATCPQRIKVREKLCEIAERYE